MQIEHGMFDFLMIRVGAKLCRGHRPPGSMFPTIGLNIMPENGKNSTKLAEKIQNNRFPVEFQTSYRNTFL